MKILLVEPENANTGSLYETVKKYIHSVDKVSAYDTLVSYARTGNYDLIILNPVYSSEEYIFRTVRLRKRKIKLPIFFVSASSTIEARVLALDNGADDAISRPFDLEEFYARIRALGRRHGDYSEDSMPLGDVVFNRRMHLLEKDGKSEKLGGKEFPVMEMLALNPRQIISKEKLADKIWGYDFDAEYNTVEVYISILRRKLRRLGSELKIASVRGVGYHLSWKGENGEE